MHKILEMPERFCLILTKNLFGFKPKNGVFGQALIRGYEAGMSKIFISYSHKDEEWKDKLVEHLQVMELEGYCTLWDDRKIKAGDDWFPEIEKALQEASIAVLLISAHFLTSNFIREQEVPRILGRRRKEGLRVIPIIVEPCAWKTVQWLKSIQFLPRDGEPLSKGNENEIDAVLAKLAEDIAALLKTKDKIEPGNRYIPVPPEKVSISKLPSTGPKLFGREAVAGPREAGTYDHLPRGLLARAECYRRQKQFSKAWDDLNEALEITESGSMKLYLTDYHLEAGRLCEAEGKTGEAKEHFKKAAEMIEEAGYHRRDKEVGQWVSGSVR